MSDKDQFLSIFNAHIHREGSERLLNWLEKTDFYTAPASTRFHLAIEGGLCTHSINVFKRLVQLYSMEFGDPDNKTMESIAISALLHDLCKVDFYSISMRNVKVEKNGRSEWEQQPYYTVEEKFKYGGHGGKSVFLVERFIRLKMDEAIAIFNHMGHSDRAPGDYALGNAYENCPLAFLLHVADEFASFIDEKE